MIERLGSGGEEIFDVEFSHDKTALILTEACDGCCSTKLTKAQVIALANDLLAIAEMMPNA